MFGYHFKTVFISLYLFLMKTEDMHPYPCIQIIDLYFIALFLYIYIYIYIYLLGYQEKVQISNYSPENDRKYFIVTFILTTIDCMCSGMSRYAKDL